MDIFNLLTTGLFDLLFVPFRPLPPVWGLLAVSLGAGILMLWLFGKLSDQDRVKLVRDNIRGNLLGIRIFGDDIGLLFRLQGKIMAQTGVYLRLALVPLIVIFIPVLVILFQLNLRFEVRPLGVGDSTIVKVTLNEGNEAATESIRLEVPEGLTVSGPEVRTPDIGEVVWEVRAEQEGEYDLLLQADSQEPLEKKLKVGGGWGPTSTLRSSAFLDLLLYPGEPAIESGHTIKSIEVTYPYLEISVLGWNIHWLVIFFVMSLVFGFAFKNALGVEI